MKKSLFIDLRENEAFIYEIEKAGDTFSVKDTVSVSLNNGAVAGIDRTYEGIKETYLSLPLSLLNFRIIELPFSDREKIRELLSFEMDSLVLGGSENAVFDCTFLGKNNGKSRVLVVYIAKDRLRALLDSLAPLKLDPKAITSVDLASVLTSSGSEKEIANLLIDPNPISGDARVNLAYQQIREPVINLRSGEFAYTADTERKNRSLRIASVVCVLALVLFLADMALRIISSNREMASIKAEMRRTYSSLFPEEKKITDELYQLKAHVKELKTKEDIFVGVSPLQFLLKLSNMIQAGIVFSEITMEKERIILKGECPSLSEVEQIKKKLGEFLYDVTVTDVKPSSREKTVFTITAKERMP
jgi:type II secretory pathway component PulL